MPNVTNAVAVEHGQKTIKFTIHFWTDGIAPERGQIVPRHMHGSGWVIVHNQEAHGITYNKVAFNSMAGIPMAIEKAILQSNITVVNSSREDQYRIPRTGNIYDWPERAPARVTKSEAISRLAEFPEAASALNAWRNAEGTDQGWDQWLRTVHPQAAAQVWA